MQTLGDDLVLLSVGPNGKIQDDQPLAVSSAGSELVRLAARRGQHRQPMLPAMPQWSPDGLPAPSGLLCAPLSAD
jgi:hypothetical protein